MPILVVKADSTTVPVGLASGYASWSQLWSSGNGIASVMWLWLVRVVGHDALVEVHGGASAGAA